MAFLFPLVEVIIEACAAAAEVATEAAAIAGEAGTIAGEAGTIAGEAGTIAGEAGTIAGEAGTIAGETGTIAGEVGTAVGEGVVGAEVADMAGVTEMAEAPMIESTTSEATIQNFIQQNPFGQRLWSFAKWAAKNTAEAGLIYGFMYGLNKAVAMTSKKSAKKMPLSVYLKLVKDNFERTLHIPWTDELEKEAADGARGFPWIDADK
eukprot:Em0002g416a